MKQEIISLKSQFDNNPLEALLIYDQTPIKGIVQFAHGMCEHKERYTEVMTYLAKQGYACGIIDHRGHGRSLEKPEDLGWFRDKTGTGIVEDTHQFGQLLKEKFPNVPLTLIGHSMGSFVVRCTARKYDKDIDKLIVCGSPSKNPASGFAISLIDFLTLFQGERHLSKLMASLSTGAYDKAVPGIKNSWLNTQEDCVKAYNADPLCGFTFTLNGYRNLMVLMRDTYSDQGWAMENPDLPIFFISGAEDPCAVNREQFDAAVEHMKSHGYTQVTSRMFDGMRHEILNEKDKEEVWKAVADFILTQAETIKSLA